MYAIIYHIIINNEVYNYVLLAYKECITEPYIKISPNILKEIKTVVS